MSYYIRCELVCDDCGTHSRASGVIVERADRAGKSEAMELAKERGWYVHGNGETVFCPNCKGDR